MKKIILSLVMLYFLFSLVSVVSAKPLTCTEYPDIISLWHFDENGTALDECGTNDGIIEGATFTSSGKYGGAYIIDGVDDYINISYSADLYPSNRDFSFSLWTKVEGVDRGILGQVDDANVPMWFWYYYNSGGVQVWEIYLEDLSDYSDSYGTTAINDSEWHNLVMVINTSEEKLYGYVDGVMEINTSFNLSINNTQDFIIGYYPSLAYSLDGSIDEMALWHKALSQEEVLEFYGIKYDLNGTYTLMRDLDFNDDDSYDNPANKVNYTTGEGWYPLGRLSVDGFGFTGTFDGQGYTISNLFMNRYGDGDDNGLFGALYSGAEVKNLGLLNVNITGDEYVGAIAGNMYSGTKITNSYTTGLVKGDSYVGGLVGYTDTASVINSSSSANVIGGEVTGGEAIGGLVGNKNDGMILNSYSTGNVNGFIYVGGLVGDGEDNSIITNCYSTGNINGNTSIGGLVGEIGINSVTTNCYATGNIIGNTSVGGLMGSNYGNITNSYSFGSVTGISNVGGLVGLTNYGTITNSFYDTETSGQNDTGKGTPKTTAEMKDITTFTFWDIVLYENWVDEVWFINGYDYDYPKLFFEYAEYSPYVPPFDARESTIYRLMNSFGAGLGLFFIYLAKGLPVLLIGLALVGIIFAIGIAVAHIIRRFKLK